MITKEGLLSQRERLILWVPIITIILISVMEFTPFYQLQFNMTEPDMSDGELTFTNDFYDDYQHSHASSEDWFQSNESNEFFGGNMEEIREIEDPDDDNPFAFINQMMIDIDSDLSTWMIISMILFLLLITGIKEKIHVNKIVNQEVITGALLAFISVTSIFLIFSIMGNGSDFSEEAFGDVDDGDADEFEHNEGFWGGIYSEEENSDGDVIRDEVTWGPHIGFFLLIILSMITLLGAISCFITQFEQFDVEQAPKWFTSEEAPDFITKNLDKLPSILIAATILLAIGSVFTPWYQIEQTWESVDDEENRTTHDFAWTMSPFFVIFDNQSGLDDKVEGEKSTSYDSYSAHHELENISEPMLELRWPLICIFLLCAIMITKRLSTKIANAIEGEEKGWNTLFLAAIVISISLTNSAFEEGIFRKAEDDLDDLSPSFNTKPSFSGARDSNFGQQYDMVVIGNWWAGEDISVYQIQITWGNAIGATLSSLASMVGLFAIALIWAPFIIRHINETKLPTFGKEQLEPWRGRPAIVMMLSVLIITSLGGGVGELLASSKSSAPEGLYKWRFDYDRYNGFVDDSGTLSDGQTVTLSMNTNEQAPGNTTYIDIYIYCDEGESDPVVDRIDEISWSLSAPEGVDTSYFQTSGEMQCNTNGNADYVTAFVDSPFPSGEIWAANSEEALSHIKWNETLTGTWEITLTAEVLGGGHPLESDPNLFYYFEIRASSIDGIYAEIDEEEFD